MYKVTITREIMTEDFLGMEYAEFITEDAGIYDNEQQASERVSELECIGFNATYSEIKKVF